MTDLDQMLSDLAKQKQYATNYDFGQRIFYVQAIFAILSFLEAKSAPGVSQFVLENLESFADKARQGPQETGTLEGIEIELGFFREKIEHYHEKKKS